MTADRTLRVFVGIIAAILMTFAASQASAVLAPLTLALFTIAIVWPLQHWLQARWPPLLALATTISVTVAVCLAFASLAVWGFGRVFHSLLADAARYQALYDAAMAWLENRGVSAAALWAEHFNASSLLRLARQVTGRANTTLTFWLITLVYVILGLLEVGDVARRVQALDNPDVSRFLAKASAATADKFRKYMIVRTQMSVVTGLLVWVFAWAVGLEFSLEWGIIAFVLNYIPFLGPFVATVFPTVLALTQFTTWRAVLGVFIGLNLIQFIVGSYVEPRVSGGVLSISPFVVLFSVVFWAFLWGVYGAFIGVPIVIAILTFCEHHPSTRFWADLFGAPKRGAEAAAAQ